MFLFVACSVGWCVAQDTNSVQVFRFNIARGDLAEVGKPYAIPSPNFVCPIDVWRRPTATIDLDGRIVSDGRGAGSGRSGRIAMEITSKL